MRVRERHPEADPRNHSYLGGEESGGWARRGGGRVSGGGKYLFRLLFETKKKKLYIHDLLQENDKYYIFKSTSWSRLETLAYLASCLLADSFNFTPPSPSRRSQESRTLKKTLQSSQKCVCARAVSCDLFLSFDFICWR